jgi:hypothetical protein
VSIRLGRFLALLFAALALTMTSAHVLEMPPKMALDARTYAFINGALYRYFALVGGAYVVGSMVFACLLAWLVRKDPRSSAWTFAGALFIVGSLAAWVFIVQPVNAQAVSAAQSAPGTLATVWQHLRPRWEYGHLTSFVLQLIGFCALVWSAVVEQPARA